jgi:hypothetical protein
MVRIPNYGLTAKALAYARRRYETTNVPMHEIGADVGKSRDVMYKIAKAEGWQLRMHRPPQDVSQAVKIDMQATEAVENEQSKQSQAEPPGADPQNPANADSIAARLEAAVEQELCEVESLHRQSPKGRKRSAVSERIARTLATLTETLVKVRRLRQPGNISASHDDDLPSDPDAFRLELARRIEAFVRSRTDASVCGSGKPATEPRPAS